MNALTVGWVVCENGKPLINSFDGRAPAFRNHDNAIRVLNTLRDASRTAGGSRKTYTLAEVSL